jgi:general L-amino acid transport system permease protein
MSTSAPTSTLDRWRAEWLVFRRQAAIRGPVWLAMQVIITAVALWVLWVIARGLLLWATRSAEWGVVAANLRLFTVGQYPKAEVWRPAASLALMAALVGITAGLRGGAARGIGRMLAAALVALLVLPVLAGPFGPMLGPSLVALLAAFGGGAAPLAAAVALLVAGWVAGSVVARSAPEDEPDRSRLSRVVLVLWLAAAPAVILLLHGGGLLPRVPVRDWGGLLLTLLLAAAALLLAFPLGILLALGRRSSLPLVKIVSVLYIELIRGVPLVTVLYMASLMVPLVLPQGVRPENMIRAIAGFALFIAAYVAEDVRGGLAALGRGQYEAARAVGLGTAAMYRLVILPQAIRVVVPSLVGQFISLFKDTSLVVIVSLREMMGIALVVVSQAEWLGKFRESMVFVAVVYFVISYAMSRTSRRLELRRSRGAGGL